MPRESFKSVFKDAGIGFFSGLSAGMGLTPKQRLGDHTNARKRYSDIDQLIRPRRRIRKMHQKWEDR